jgi:cupin superfamily acireductone dioxygenase involved in methionine salvage
MAGRPKKLENLSTRELAEMQVRVKRARIIKENHHKDMLRLAITKLAKENGFSVRDLISR